MRLCQQFGGAPGERDSRNDQEAPEYVESHHSAYAENERTEEDELGEELFCKVSRAAPVYTYKGERAQKKKKEAKTGLAQLRGDEGGECHTDAHNAKDVVQLQTMARGGQSDCGELMVY